MLQVVKGSRIERGFLLLVGVVAFVGCADNGMIQVAGDVTIDGVAIVQGTIGFFPTQGQGPTAEAVIDGGKYSVSLPPGKKNVVIHGYQKIGEKFPWGKESQAMPILKEIVPADFNADSKLTADLQTDKSDLHFELHTQKTATK
jgi:hypothetical protein